MHVIWAQEDGLYTVTDWINQKQNKMKIGCFKLNFLVTFAQEENGIEINDWLTSSACRLPFFMLKQESGFSKIADWRLLTHVPPINDQNTTQQLFDWNVWNRVSVNSGHTAEMGANMKFPDKLRIEAKLEYLLEIHPEPRRVSLSGDNVSRGSSAVLTSTQPEWRCFPLSGSKAEEVLWYSTVHFCEGTPSLSAVVSENDAGVYREAQGCVKLFSGKDWQSWQFYLNYPWKWEGTEIHHRVWNLRLKGSNIIFKEYEELKGKFLLCQHYPDKIMRQGYVKERKLKISISD